MGGISAVSGKEAINNRLSRDDVLGTRASEFEFGESFRSRRCFPPPPDHNPDSDYFFLAQIFGSLTSALLPCQAAVI